MLQKIPSFERMSTGRIEAFSDGVFAIAITLLILNIQVPKGQGGRLLTEPELLAALREQWLMYLSFLLSVMIVGVFWVAHHGIFSLIQRTDRPLFWLNIFYLSCVAFLPFPTALLGQYGSYRAPVIIYGISLIVTGLILDLIRRHATSGHRLVSPDLSEKLIKAIQRRNLLGPSVYFCAVMVALTPIRLGSLNGPKLAICLYVLMPIVYMIPSRFDRHLSENINSK